MKTTDFAYDLPEELIAQKPAEPRDKARLLVLNRKRKSLTHTFINKIDQFLDPGDLIVFNKTRVLPARLHAKKIPSGGTVEILLLSQRAEQVWEVLVGGRRIHTGQSLRLVNGIDAEVITDLPGARREVRFSRPLDSYLGEIGITPLPPYIKRTIEDPERYQTIFAEHSGSAAAPTAGLHFSPRLFARLAGKGIRCASITLHIGLDTFGPVVVEDPDDHQIHTEWCKVPPETAALVNRTREAGNRVVAIGTTCVRALETAAAGVVKKHSMTAYEGQTSLFMKPGYSFQVVDTILTNFHLPRSTLLMMICGFAGREFVLETYKVAVNYGYRFYSFGDAMLIL